MKKIVDVTDLRGKFVILRTSLNVPLVEGKIRNKFRIEKALPSMRYLKEHRAKTIVIAHIGRGENETLKPIYEELEKYLPIHWGGRIENEGFRQRREIMQDGDILVAENIRQNPGEVTNDDSLVNTLASLGDLYVNDAFAVSHREHASTFGIIKKLPSYVGLTFSEEITELTKATSPSSPSLFLLGGSKFDTKLPLVEKYLKLYDQVFIGGALANDIFKAKGYEIGQSQTSEISLDDSILNNAKLIVPIDVIVDGPNGRQAKTLEEVKNDEKILDCGPNTIDMVATYIENAKTVLWNGPFGAYESGYSQSTEIIARHIAAAEAFTIVGGGDTLAAIERLEINDLFSFVSIGGGAMLTFLQHGSTSVIEALD